MKTIAEQLGVKDFPFKIKDERGNEIYHEDRGGFWWKYEYDQNGKKIYFESSRGYWCKWEYDKNGNEIYYETSDEHWSKQEYDENGNEIYFETSTGYIIDNRPKPCENKVVEIDGVKYELKPVK